MDIPIPPFAASHDELAGPNVDEHGYEQGLTHPPTLLASLPSLNANTNAPPSAAKAKVLSAQQFSQMHMRHTLAHAPDGVLFPFLHGLEGDNHAQNTFFNATSGKRRVPRFRGLVWVVAEEDLDLDLGAPPSYVGGVGTPEDEFDEDLESDEEEEESEEDDELGMDVDVDNGVRIVRSDEHQQQPPIATLEEQAQHKDEDGKHMHPVHHRLQTIGLPLGSPSTAGTSEGERDAFLGNGTGDVEMEISLPPPGSGSGSGSDTSSSSYSSEAPNTPAPATTQAQNPATNGVANTNGRLEEWDPARPPLLTCTFRPRELVRRVVGSGERPPLIHASALAPNGHAALSSGSLSHLNSHLNGSAPVQTQGGAEKKEEQKEEEWEFRPARVPDGISLRNFGIQVPIYATLSDIVLYSPRGLSSPTLPALAARFVSAVERKRRERCKAMGINPDTPSPEAPLEYNVFVLDADARQLREAVPELMMRVFEGGERRLPSGIHGGEGMQIDGETDAFAAAHAAHSDAPVAVPISPDADATTSPNTVDFGQRERDEMRELTRASEILSVFPSATRYPGPPGAEDPAAEGTATEREDLSTTTTASHWRPAVGQVYLGNSGDVPLGGDGGVGPNEDPFAEGMGYDVCVECHEMAPFPSLAHLRAAEDHLVMLDGMWDERVRAENGGEGAEGRVRPPPNAGAVIHLPFPSAPSNTAQTMNAILPVIAFLERATSANNAAATSGSGSARRWSTFPAAVSPAAFFPAPPTPPGAPPRTRSLTSPAPSPAATPAPPPRTRPLKVLIYSSDGYTESSPLALSLLMAVRRLTLPEAYLELQVAKRRSFFVYPGELGLLRRVEARIGGGEVFAPVRLGRRMSGAGASTGSLGSAGGAQMASAIAEAGPTPTPTPPPPSPPTPFSGARPSAKSVSFAPGAVISPPVMVPSQGGAVTRSGRPRARTSPWLPSFGDHQSWFNDPRFDGSFPSRVLPFLYLGNLNHASNAYMLHALGITHVVSVGECALVPPPGHCTAPADAACTSATCRANHSANAHFIQGKGPGNQGSLWIEEREGRIKVLDIKGVCDDGIDTLEPQLEPICEWIEKARQEGGQVLVHCRVGVSRSATVTIAYVMKHLSLPLVDAYLIVRSRRLSVLIQPNMRLLYNLCGWEIKLAKERAGGDEARLRKELARTLTWPYLSKEVHALNEKYLH
ncbi:hypothetical protein MVEN_02143700 [Mycena venus]|uniref:Protein-tyrosine-phosphatase n=1 Tax=Mycena venus TaxID=2733690 RepID=A0A8H6X9D8_9AGAR|nr:hypothetical protein MVEN_02143700 [Mycena venus]